MPPKKEEPKKWKAPKGPKPIQRKNKNTIGLGRSIANVRSKENRIEYLPDGEMRFTTDKHEADWVKLRSVTQETALDEFLNTAELADTDFAAEKRATVKIIKVDPNKNPYLLSGEEQEKKHKLQEEHEFELKVPRRPIWDSNTTKFQLEKAEKEAFLDWRRQLALLQENEDLLLTPFERNIEVWKQLWRVVERSDLVVQIVDARNPLLFRSKDLEKYVKELDERKNNLLLVNKADLLTAKQRLAWANYFIENKIKYTFFSAAEANELLAKEELESQSLNGNLNEINNSTNTKIEIGNEIFNKEKSEIDSKIKILKIEELEELFLKEAPEPLTIPLRADEPAKLQIGLVGYPNVGKSSTINALVGAKKVSVSSTPGKTKHFQTIQLSPKVILCDCPGLVFPNFAYTNSELVCCGVLPIDQLRESTGPCQLVAQRIPKYFLEAVYGIAIPTKAIEEGGSGIPTAQELLTAYARARGYMTQGFGSADESRAARYILKDYVNGKLLFTHCPPNNDNSLVTLEQEREFNMENFSLEKLPEQRIEQIIQAAKEKNININEIDLARDLSKLTFSSHASIGDEGKAKTSSNYGGKQAALTSATDELDREFFNMKNVKGKYTTPFHKLTNDANSNKKHNKKNKKGKTRTLTSAATVQDELI
ncbi:hypothetical protein PACTADRAFT_55755 [Pachysolen tannophilus NRRL Y-2460]|uniref:CP-type G domain-containing protein n=1 Tax=Pachysolen tannophilus NRRL Y-2460 TaxID=669874 RepID=A0A1E4TZW8_PACTA|nr:hypothetical protein PACTADRAFT_55755 [Pachysolen tannophilus NRRL Y-2460]